MMRYNILHVKKLISIPFSERLFIIVTLTFFLQLIFLVRSNQLLSQYTLIFLILRIRELYTHQVCLLLKNWATFLTYLFCWCMFVNKHFAYLECPYLKKWKVVLHCEICYTIFNMKKNILNIFISTLVYL